MRALRIPVIAGAMIIIGIYFFPLGEDIVFKTLLDGAGGDYWLARAYQYFIFGSMIFVGFILLKYGAGGAFKIYALVGLVIAALWVAGAF